MAVLTVVANGGFSLTISPPAPSSQCPLRLFFILRAIAVNLEQEGMEAAGRAVGTERRKTQALQTFVAGNKKVR